MRSLPSRAGGFWGGKKGFGGDLEGRSSGSREGVVALRFWGVCFDKMMRGRSCGRKEAGGGCFPRCLRRGAALPGPGQLAGCVSYLCFVVVPGEKTQGNPFPTTKAKKVSRVAATSDCC